MTPPESMEGAEHYRSRREFLTTCFSSLAGITIVGVVAPILSSCNAGPSLVGVDASYQASFNVATLATDGTALVTTTDGGDGFPIIIVRQSASTFLALSTQCPHQGCQVNAPRNNLINCNCHGSEFDLQGNVVHGPANAGLYRYTTSYDSSTRMLTVKAA